MVTQGVYDTHTDGGNVILVQDTKLAVRMLYVGVGVVLT